MQKFFHVDFFSINHDEQGRCGLILEHNDVVGSFEELAEISQGRLAVVTGEATMQEYVEQQIAKRS